MSGPGNAVPDRTEVWDTVTDQCPFCMGELVMTTRRPPFVITDGMAIRKVRHTEPPCYEFKTGKLYE